MARQRKREAELQTVAGDPLPPVDPTTEAADGAASNTPADPSSVNAEAAVANAAALFQNRLLSPEEGGYRMVKASTIKVHPKNWRTHPEFQTGVIKNVLKRIGWVDALKCRILPDDTLELLDGHLRQEVSGDEMVPVLVSRLSDQEADEILATFDQITSLAVADQDKLSGLLKELQTANVPLIDLGWPEYRLDQVLNAGWTPAITPTASTEPVTQEDIQQAGADVADGFSKPPELVTVLCPHCAQEFSVNPADFKKPKQAS